MTCHARACHAQPGGTLATRTATAASPWLTCGLCRRFLRGARLTRVLQMNTPA